MLFKIISSPLVVFSSDIFKYWHSYLYCGFFFVFVFFLSQTAFFIFQSVSPFLISFFFFSPFLISYFHFGINLFFLFKGGGGGIAFTHLGWWPVFEWAEICYKSYVSIVLVTNDKKSFKEFCDHGGISFR